MSVELFGPFLHLFAVHSGLTKLQELFDVGPEVSGERDALHELPAVFGLVILEDGRYRFPRILLAEESLEGLKPHLSLFAHQLLKKVVERSSYGLERHLSVNHNSQSPISKVQPQGFSALGTIPMINIIITLYHAIVNKERSTLQKSLIAIFLNRL